MAGSRSPRFYLKFLVFVFITASVALFVSFNLLAPHQLSPSAPPPPAGDLSQKPAPVPSGGLVGDVERVVEAKVAGKGARLEDFVREEAKLREMQLNVANLYTVGMTVRGEGLTGATGTEGVIAAASKADCAEVRVGVIRRELMRPSVIDSDPVFWSKRRKLVDFLMEYTDLHNDIMQVCAVGRCGSVTRARGGRLRGL